MASIRKFISIEKEWVPYSQTSTLYIRPALIGTEVSKLVDISLYIRLTLINYIFRFKVAFIKNRKVNFALISSLTVIIYYCHNDVKLNFFVCL